MSEVVADIVEKAEEEKTEPIPEEVEESEPEVAPPIPTRPLASYVTGVLEFGDFSIPSNVQYFIPRE